MGKSRWGIKQPARYLVERGGNTHQWGRVLGSNCSVPTRTLRSWFLLGWISLFYWARIDAGMLCKEFAGCLEINSSGIGYVVEKVNPLYMITAGFFSFLPASRIHICADWCHRSWNGCGSYQKSYADDNYIRFSITDFHSSYTLVHKPHFVKRWMPIDTHRNWTSDKLRFP